MAGIAERRDGLAEDAQKEGAALLEPTTDVVDYNDGTTGEAYGFDIPVPAIGEEFDCALVGTKGKWYDHKVSVSNPVLKIEDGEYTCAVTLAGGSGKASIQSPAKITVKDGDNTDKRMTVTDTKAFGEAIRKRRKELGYTQAYLSEFTGMSVSFLSDLENGKPTIELEKAIRIANLLGLDCALKERD